MDPITHTLVGAALAQSGLGRRTAYATAALLIGSNLPDMDAVSQIFGMDTALGFRRGWTHGFPALLALPLLLTGVLFLLDGRRRRFRPIAAPPAKPRVLLLLSISLI